MPLRREILPTTQLSALSRRQVLAIASASIVASSRVPSARADIDYSKIQDLLGTPDTNQQTYTPGGPRPTWLTEPTEEFRANEIKATEFKRAQLQAKANFIAALEKLETDPNDEDLLAKDLDQMRYMVRSGGGLPLGVTKEELIKRVRRRKAKRFWPTTVEIA